MRQAVPSVYTRGLLIPSLSLVRGPGTGASADEVGSRIGSDA
jgi:hypothetical protein